MWAFSHLLFSVCMLRCICVWERLLSLTFMYIISVASGEGYIDSSQSGSILQSRGTQQCSGLFCMPRKPFSFWKSFTCSGMFEICLEKMVQACNCVLVFFFVRVVRASIRNRLPPRMFPNGHAHSLQNQTGARVTPSVHATECVYNMFISLPDSLPVHLCVCNSAKRCGRGRISWAFLSLACFISKDEPSQAGRQTQSYKTAEQMQMRSARRDASGDRWWV